jgi:hypothetical protein
VTTGRPAIAQHITLAAPAPHYTDDHRWQICTRLLIWARPTWGSLGAPDVRLGPAWSGGCRRMEVRGLGEEDPGQRGPYRFGWSSVTVGWAGCISGPRWLADRPAGRAVAVEVIDRPGAVANRPGYRQRFAREASAAMAVSGIYTASGVEAETEESVLIYRAAEFVVGSSLADSVWAGPCRLRRCRARQRTGGGADRASSGGAGVLRCQAVQHSAGGERAGGDRLRDRARRASRHLHSPRVLGGPHQTPCWW